MAESLAVGNIRERTENGNHTKWIEDVPLLSTPSVWRFKRMVDKSRVPGARHCSVPRGQET